MAFKPKNAGYHVDTRGVAGFMSYNDQGDNLSTIKGANYFNHNDVRGFILKQREDNGTAANNPIRCQIIASDGMEVVALVLADNGNVSIRAGAGWLID